MFCCFCVHLHCAFKYLFTARAAALGLEYPGVHGAPDLSSPSASLMHPKTFSFDDLAPSEYSMNLYEGNELVEAPSEYPLYTKFQPMGFGRFPLSHGPFMQASRGHTADQMLGFPRGQSVREPESSLEVKHVAPPTLTKARSRADSMNLRPQGRRNPLLFSQSEHNPAGDESAPNRYGMALTEFAPLRSLGRAAYQGQINHEREVPFLRSPHRLHRRRGWPAIHGLWKAVRHPVRLAQSGRKRTGISPLFQGRAILQALRKTK